MHQPKEPLPGVWKTSDDRWVLVKPRLYTTYAGDVTVPAGFYTDLASIPRVLWWMLPPWGRYDNAAILHDYLYQTGLFSRQIADQCLYNQMEKDGVSYAVRAIVWGAVRLFGKQFYGPK